MRTYLDEHGAVIDNPAVALSGNVFVYSTRRGDFVFPIEGRLLTISSEEKEASCSAEPTGIIHKDVVYPACAVE